MSDLRALEALQALHGELVAVRQHRYEGLQTLDQLLDAQSDTFKKLIDKPPRNSANRTALGTGRDARARVGRRRALTLPLAPTRQDQGRRRGIPRQ